ncbi:heme exporter protein CcmB [Flammeovirga yaeyamensis]|uniref:Heme exporter protein CcmB n=1 Tax=Flammeovirga yaeyamensis TaxID=367791 RepID=A0AAX1N5J5_9BACT|nr:MULTISPECIES: heme exporter protein CcmB [Flammeovirga]ANQ49791.1 ABC transporter permease [Flammeovirga sp. MY04]MBB3697347.1 heme exporter protein B [Flammeovirga yaeyamensis]NMF36041.1 ABC transporter permease [Flammeovirga yaeyamensis]QWG02776.1 heme exporter protein CcmB [Flammeovirga yaeyamensis]
MNSIFSEIGILLKKDATLEWREKTNLNGLLLFTISTVFVCYLSFNQKSTALSPITWNTLFWIIQLFAALNGASNSFTKESKGRHFYYYQMISPQAIILSKIIYNAFLMMLISFIGLGVYSLVLGNPIQDFGLFAFVVFLGGFGFSSSLTLVAGIASKAQGNSTLMAVLGLPAILPMILMLIKLSKNAIDGIARSQSMDEILVIFAIDIIIVTVSFLLFPYLWRS